MDLPRSEATAATVACGSSLRTKRFSPDTEETTRWDSYGRLMSTFESIAAQAADVPARLHKSLTPALILALVAGPALHLVGIAFLPGLKSSEAAQLAVIADHPTRWYIYTMFLLAGSVTMIAASAALIRLGADGMRRVGALGGTLVGLGFVGSVVDLANQLWAWQMARGGTDRSAMAALLLRFDNDTATSLPFAVTGIGLLVGTVMLTVALVRNPAVPSWAAIAFCASIFINIVTFSNNNVPGVAASFALMTGALGGIAVAARR